MGTEQLYFIIGFLLGILLTGCLFIAGLIIYYEWIKKIKMIICVCRNIKESDFTRQEDLIERIMQADHKCGQCQEYVQKLKELL